MGPIRLLPLRNLAAAVILGSALGCVVKPQAPCPCLDASTPVCSTDAGPADAGGSGQDGGLSPSACSPSDAGSWAPDAGAPPAFTTWPVDKVLYQVLVRSFLDTNGDGFGDFAGLTSKLDYIQSLGVDGILLLPAWEHDYFQSAGYAATDFHHAEKDYGGDPAFDAFVAAAHARGLKVLIDFAITGTADTHPWFVSAKANPCVPERSHYNFIPAPCPFIPGILGFSVWDPTPDNACYRAEFHPIVPQLNYRDPTTAEGMISTAVEWISRGVDGFRLDYAAGIAPRDPAQPTAYDDNSPQTHLFWRQFMSRIKAANPNVFVLGEIYSNQAAFYGDGIDSILEYGVWGGMRDAMLNQRKSNGGQGLTDQVTSMVARHASGGMGAIFLENGDVPAMAYTPYGRMSDVVSGYPNRLINAAMLLLSLPATPIIFYGSEIGLMGAPSVWSPFPGSVRNWSFNPMHWDASPTRGFTSGQTWTPFATEPYNVADQSGVGGSILETYRTLGRVRRSSPALKSGSYLEVGTADGSVYAYLRQSTAPERVLVVSNLSSVAKNATLDLATAGITSAAVSDRITGVSLPAVTSSNASSYPLALPAYSARWLLLN